MKPTPASIAKDLGLPALASTLEKFWDEAQAARPAGHLRLLDEASIVVDRAAMGMPSEYDRPLLDIAHLVRENPALTAVAWYLHWNLFVRIGGADPGIPEFSQRLSDDQAGRFFLLLALGFGPALRLRHRVWGYPEAVTTAGFAQIGEGITYHQRGAGTLGYYGRNLCWLRKFFASPYVILGRLAFQVASYASPFEVWRRNSDGAILMLATTEVGVDDHGLLAPNAVAPAWRTTVTRSDVAIESHPVAPTGYIQRKVVHLELKHWSPFLVSGDQVLSIHIPPGGGLALEKIQDSFHQARDFFARHHRDMPLKALWCATWFLDPRLEQLLPPTANILILQRCLYLHPIVPWEGILWHIFLGPTEDASRLPRETSLQRTLADFLAAGGHWNGGAGFIPLDAVDSLGEGSWRAQFLGLSVDGAGDARE